MMHSNQQNQSHKLLFEKKYWTINDCVEFTGYARGTIYNLASRGEIPHQKKRRRLIFHPQEILNWMYTQEN